MTHTIVAVGKSTNSVITPMMTAPIVAPMSGIRSKSAMSSPSAPANGTPRIERTIHAVTPAIVACTRTPAT